MKQTTTTTLSIMVIEQPPSSFAFPFSHTADSRIRFHITGQTPPELFQAQLSAFRCTPAPCILSGVFPLFLLPFVPRRLFRFSPSPRNFPGCKAPDSRFLCGSEGWFPPLPDNFSPVPLPEWSPDPYLPLRRYQCSPQTFWQPSSVRPAHISQS